MAQSSTPRSATAHAVVLVAAIPSLRPGRPLHGFGGPASRRDGFSAQKAGAHFLMQMRSSDRPSKDALTASRLRSIRWESRRDGLRLLSTAASPHRSDGARRPLDQVWARVGRRADAFRKDNFGSSGHLESSRVSWQILAASWGAVAPLDRAGARSAVLRGGVPLVACFHWICNCRGARLAWQRGETP